MTQMIYFCILSYSKINEKKVILVDYDSWEAEYSLKYNRIYKLWLFDIIEFISFVI